MDTWKDLHPTRTECQDVMELSNGRILMLCFENPETPEPITATFRVYSLGLDHKHVPEIQAHGGLGARPLLVPSYGFFRQGMLVQIPLQLGALPGSPRAADLHGALARHYRGRRFVTVADPEETRALEHLDPEEMNGTNALKLHVLADEAEGQAVLLGVLDNLGKGASGQAVQNLNLMLGFPESEGLDGPPPSL